MKKTKFSSYCINGIPEGCRHCVKGRKLVLFISGVCSRNCFYCSLSNKRKNVDVVWANERVCKDETDALKEAAASNATSAGITGGDPLLFLKRTMRYASLLKKRFKDFHIHIYLPTKLVDRRKLKELSKCIDEVRFHPSFLMKNTTEEEMKKEIEKIKLAGLFFKRKDIGCELPVLPGKKKEIFEFIKEISPFVGFVNLNEFELSDTNFEHVTMHCKLNEDTYTISGSKEAGIWILKQCEKAKLKIKVHVCTAKLKNLSQYQNRLKLHKILPYGYRTEEGSVRYFVICFKDKAELERAARDLKKLRHFFVDRRKNRIIISENIADKVLHLNKYKLARVEEFPTFDRTEVQFEYL